MKHSNSTRPKELISTQDLLAFAKRHRVSLGRKSPYRTLKYYVQLGLLPPKRRYWDQGIRWGFPPQAKALLLRIRDLKQQGLRLRESIEKVSNEVEAAYQNYKNAPATLGRYEGLKDPSFDYNYSFLYEKVKEARNLQGSGMSRNVKEILDELEDLLRPSSKDIRVMVISEPPMTEVYRVTSRRSADYLCSVYAIDPVALEKSYGKGWFHCIKPGKEQPELVYDLLIPDTDDLPVAKHCRLRKTGPTLHFGEKFHNCQYKIYRMEGKNSTFVCKAGIGQVSTEVLAKEYGRSRFRLVHEHSNGTKYEYGLIIDHVPENQQGKANRPIETSHSSLTHSDVKKEAIISAQPGLEAKCPVCREKIMKPDGHFSFFSTNGLLYDHRDENFLIKCRKCRTSITVIIELGE